MFRFVCFDIFDIWNLKECVKENIFIPPLPNTNLSYLLSFQKWLILCQVVMALLWPLTESQVGRGVLFLLCFYLYVWGVECIFISLSPFLSSRWRPVESELRITRRGGLPVLRWLTKTRPPPVPCHGNAALPHLLLCQQPGRSTLHTEVELSVCEGASQRTNTTCVR